ncbi:MAG: VirB4 family type IV secretion system protein [Bacillota bacterium]
MALSLKALRKPRPEVTAQGWLPVAERPGRGLQPADGREIRLLAVGSLHLRLRSNQERKRILKAEEELYNGLRFPVMRLTLPVPLDLSLYEAEVIGQIADDPNQQRAGLLADKLDHVQTLIHERHLVQWRNLVVIPGPAPRAQANELPLGERVQLVRSGLEHCGLPVKELDPAESAQVWLELLRPDEAEANPIRLMESGLLDRITPPEGFDFSPAQYFRVGERFCRVLVMTRYPRHVTPAHFADLYRIDRRVMVVQHIHPTDSEELQREISNSIGEMHARLAGTLSEYEKEATKARLRDAQRLLKKLAGENHNVLDLSMYLLLRAESLDELEELTRRIQGRLRGKGMRARPLRFTEQPRGLTACLPVAQDPLRAIARRNIPAQSVPAAFPYANAELTQGRGFVMGINKDTGNLVLIDPWQLMNAHSVFIGTSGSGKTFTLNELLTQFWSWGIPIRSIDIEGDKGRLCQDLGGQRVRLAPYAGNYINPMEVRRPPLDPSLFLDAEAEEPANGLAASIQRQMILFTLMLPDASPVELSRAESLVIEAYQRRGITFETDFAGLGRTDWPTWRELQPLLASDPVTQRLAAVMYSWVYGSLAGMFDQPTNVDLDNQYVLLDIHDVMGHRLARGPVFFQAMTFLWDEINRDWREWKILDIDELGILADSEDALEFTWRVSKSARRRRCRFQTATQDPADLLSGRSAAAQKYAQGIINNCATKVLGYLEPKALEQVAQAVRLSQAEMDLLGKLRREEKLIICGEQRAHVEVVASLRQLQILDPAMWAKKTGRVL